MRAYLARCTDPTGFYESRVLTFEGHWNQESPKWIDANDTESEEFSPSWDCGIKAIKDSLEWHSESPHLVAVFVELPDAFFGRLSSDLSSQDFDTKPSPVLPYIAAILSGKYAAIAEGKATHFGFKLSTWKLVLSDTPLPPGSSFNGLCQTEQVEWIVLTCIKSEHLSFIEVGPSQISAHIE